MASNKMHELARRALAARKVPGMHCNNDKIYSDEALLKLCLENVEKYGLLTFLDVYTLAGLNSKQFYDQFPSGSDEHYQILLAMTVNKISAKAKLRKQWQSAKASAPLQLAAYKLMGTEEEREALNMTYNRNEHAGSLDLNARIVIESVDADSPELANDETQVKD